MAITQMRRPLGTPVFHIDTNLLNARQKLGEVNQLEKWAEDGVILINMSSTAYEEAQVGNNPQRIKKAKQNIFTDSEPIDSEEELFSKVSDALFGSALLSGNQTNDVQIVCEAIKYAAILVTNDGASKSQPGGILGNRHKLEEQIQIYSPLEAVHFIRRKIKERDDLSKEYVREFGGSLPAWVGMD